MLRDIDKRIAQKLANIRQVFRAVVTLVNSASAIQLVQLDGVAGEQLQAAEQFQQYGFTSNMPAGGMAVVVPIGGKTAHGIVIATEHGSYRLKGLQTGEVALYSDEGDHVILKRGRVMDIVTQTLNISASNAVNITSPIVNMSSNLSVGVDIVASRDIVDHGNKSMLGMRTAYNLHKHGETGTITQLTDQGM